MREERPLDPSEPKETVIGAVLLFFGVACILYGLAMGGHFLQLGPVEGAPHPVLVGLAGVLFLALAAILKALLGLARFGYILWGWAMDLHELLATVAAAMPTRELFERPRPPEPIGKTRYRIRRPIL